MHEICASSSQTKSQHREGGGHEAPPPAKEVGALVGDGRERESVCFKTVAHSKSNHAQWKATYLRTHGEHNMDLMDVKISTKEDTMLGGNVVILCL